MNELTALPGRLRILNINTEPDFERRKRLADRPNHRPIDHERREFVADPFLAKHLVDRVNACLLACISLGAEAEFQKVDGLFVRTSEKMLLGSGRKHIR